MSFKKLPKYMASALRAMNTTKMCASAAIALSVASTTVGAVPSAGPISFPAGVPSGEDAKALELVQAHGWWTRCVVNLTNGVQIAVVNANTAQNCYTAGTKCANGRPFSIINHSTNPFLLSAPRVERCTFAY